MNYETKLQELNEIIAEVSDLHAASGLLGWDQQVNMPPGGAERRSYVTATLERLAHMRFTSAKVGRLLDELEPYAAQLNPDSDAARIIKVTRRNYDKQTKVPPAWVVEFTQLTSQAYQVWAKARAENDFSSFQPMLEKIVDMRRRYAELFEPFDHIYDPLLDDFEPGLKTADVIQIFNSLRPQQVALIQAIAERSQVDDSCLRQPFDEQKQWDFGVEVLTEIGYDWKRSRQDRAAHPFTSGSDNGDVRITTRFDPNYLNTALFGTLHESGHAMYELGVDSKYNRTALASGASLAVHESQSRMWENLVGRSLAFWEHFYHRLQQYFPSQLESVPLGAFYKAINQVRPSLIRVEADEATYNLHIMLRLEIEIALMEGKLEVKDLPEAWNARMQDYLGLTPPNDSLGVLQDVHWSGGMIGYFSTYALGNLISAQLWECIRADIPDLDQQISKGNFASLHSWLKEKIHRHGSKFEPQELVQRVTGSKIDPAPYVRYLKSKFGEIYSLE